jgi:hypothetical protein
MMNVFKVITNNATDLVLKRDGITLTVEPPVKVTIGIIAFVGYTCFQTLIDGFKEEVFIF